jgi:hypothetical protein
MWMRRFLSSWRQGTISGRSFERAHPPSVTPRRPLGLCGRLFTEADNNPSGQLVVIVNHQLALQSWPGGRTRSASGCASAPPRCKLCGPRSPPSRSRHWDSNDALDPSSLCRLTPNFSNSAAAMARSPKRIKGNSTNRAAAKPPTRPERASAPTWSA